MKKSAHEPSRREGSSFWAVTRDHAARPGPVHYVLVHKPYGVVSQFTTEGVHAGLGSLGRFPKDVYAAGRLDADSEGLLLLTNDGRVIHRLTDPRFGHPRTYVVQLEGIPDERALESLRRGLVLKGQKTKPATASLLSAEPDFPPRPVPIRQRKTVPTSWIEITLSEGRNRQVRHMTAAVGYPTLRLIRTSIGPLSLEGLAPGEFRDLSAREQTALLESLRLAERDRRPSRRVGPGKK